MREIKFRAWNESTKWMCYNFTDETFYFDVNLLVSKEGKDIWEIMQFTGLKDKAGKEIYEGDIMYVAGIGNVEIVFVDGCFGYIWEEMLYTFNDDQENDIENVMGNIYENPELSGDLK